MIYFTKIGGGFAQKFTNNDKQQWRIIGSGVSRIFHSELNVMIRKTLGIGTQSVHVANHISVST